MAGVETIQAYIPEDLCHHVSLMIKSSTAASLHSNSCIALYGLRRILNVMTKTKKVDKPFETRKVVDLSIIGLEIDTHSSDRVTSRDDNLRSIVGVLTLRETISTEELQKILPSSEKQRKGSVVSHLLVLKRSGQGSIVVLYVFDNINKTVIADDQILVYAYNPQDIKYSCNLKASSIPEILHKSYTQTCPGVRILPLISPEQLRSVKYSDQEPCSSSFPNLITCIKSATIAQICTKLFVMHQIFSRNKSNRLITLNLLIMLILDSALGLCLSSYLLSLPNMLENLQSGVEHLLNLLFAALNWLKGSPAGLKLNASFNMLLWRVFSYHLHLWKNYIGILEPMLSLMLWMILSAGYLGVSVQISIFKDIVTLSTFHVYCLYIYATRLFHLQSRSLKSLCRLFFGRKWNPLRKRIDFVLLNNSEMFIGSLAFTISVFLAPTTFIYYAVFLAIRLVVFWTEEMLGFLVSSINGLDFVTIFLIFFRSPRFSQDVFVGTELTALKGIKVIDIPLFRLLVQNNQTSRVNINLKRRAWNILSDIASSRVLT